MVRNGTFLRWSAKDNNEKSESIVESCLRILMRFLSLKKCMAECFLVLSSQGAARSLGAFVLKRIVMCVFQGRKKTHRYETIWLSPSHPYFRSRAFFDLRCISMVRNGTFLRWSAKDNEKSESIVESCPRILMRFLSLKSFLVLSSQGAARYLAAFVFKRLVMCVFQGRKKTHRYETIWLSPSHPYFRSRVFFDLRCISMVRNGTFLRWSAKDNERSESIVESCLRILMRFLSLKKCMAECFLVLSSQGAARYLAAFVFKRLVMCVFQGRKKTHRYETIWLSPSHPYFRSRAFFDLRSISMVRNGTFLRWSAKDNEKSESIVESCPRILMRFLSLKSFLVLSSQGAARYLAAFVFKRLVMCVFQGRKKTHRYETIWLSPSHPYFRSRVFFDLRCISMVRNGTFLRWSAKDNERSESIVESCLRILMRFINLKKCMAECFLVLSSQGAARCLAAFVLKRIVMCVFQGRKKTHRYETIWLSPSHPYFRSRALFDLRCISMVRNGTFLRWSAKDNEKSESIVESCLRILMRFLSFKKCMAECFLVLPSQGAARYLPHSYSRELSRRAGSSGAMRLDPRLVTNWRNWRGRRTFPILHALAKAPVEV